MSNGYLPVFDSGGNIAGYLQTYRNADPGGSGKQVDAEAVTLVDASGNPLVGQKAKAASLPVVLASDQTPLPLLGRDGLTLASDSNFFPIGAAQLVDSGNSAVITSVSHPNGGQDPAHPFTGINFATTANGIQECISILTAFDGSGNPIPDLGFTFTFKGNPEGIVRTVVIPNFTAKRLLHTTDWLSNQWTNYQVVMTPSRALNAGETIVIATRHSKLAGNSFLYPLNYAFLEAVQTSKLTRVVSSGINPNGDAVNVPVSGQVPSNSTSTPLPGVATTIAAGSAGQSLPQATIAVVSTSGYPVGGGTISIVTSAALLQTVTYTGISGNNFTGCTGGTGVMTLGNAVNQCFVGPFIPVSQYSSIILLGNSDQNSVTNGVEIQFSTDGVTVHDSVAATYNQTSQGQLFTSIIETLNVRVKWTSNGPQTLFSLNTTISVTSFGPPLRPLNAALDNNDSVEAVRAALAGERVDNLGTFQNARITARNTILTEPPPFASTPTTAQVPVGTGSAQLDTTPLANRVAVEVLYPLSTAHTTSNKVDGVIWVGWSNGVTASNGREIQAGESWRFDASTSITIWAISNFASQQVTITQFAP